MWIVNLANNKSFSAKTRDWNVLPNFPIVSMMYYLPNGKFLYLSGFEKYTQLKELKTIIYGGKGTRIWTWNILGKFKNQVYQFSHHLIKNKTFQTVNEYPNWRPLRIIPRINKKDSLKIEFNKPQKIPDTIWHSGVILPKSIVKIID